MAKGGYRQPANPAPVSGPGALSQRTDSGPSQAAQYVSGLPYGEGADFLDIQSSAPMEKAPVGTPQGSNATQVASPSSPLIPLDAPSARPGEPVTHGADAGPGADSSVLGLQNQQSNYVTARDLIQSLAQAPDASPALKYLAQQINGVY